MGMKIMVGNIGTGKSLIASKFAKVGDVVVNMDSITTMIGGGEYNLYDVNKKPIYKSAEEVIIRQSLEAGCNIVVDRTNMDRLRRKRYIDIAKEYTNEIIGYDFGIGDEESLNRRMKNSYGVHDNRWKMVHELMMNSYEQPVMDEGFTDIFTMNQKYTYHAFDFDGTIVENKFPDIGNIKPIVVKTIQSMFLDLSNIIIIWTCRSGSYEAEVREFLCKNHIPFDFINENPMVDFGARKIFAHKYYDDRNAEVGEK